MLFTSTPRTLGALFLSPHGLKLDKYFEIAFQNIGSAVFVAVPSLFVLSLLRICFVNLKMSARLTFCSLHPPPVTLVRLGWCLY